MNQEDMDLDGSGDACDSNTMCRGLADFDQDVDAQDVTVFLSHFGRSIFSNPCPIDGPAPVARTSWTTCYDTDGNPRDCAGTGEDGAYQKGVAWPNPRFTDNDDGTVTDNLTGLIWLKDANCFGFPTWEEALLSCNGLGAGQCGLTDGSSPGDWRLPNRFELESLFNLKYADPALSNTVGDGQWTEGDPFTNFPGGGGYWSSTTYVAVNNRAWIVVFDIGIAHTAEKYYLNSYYVWPVRGGH